MSTMQIQYTTKNPICIWANMSACFSSSIESSCSKENNFSYGNALESSERMRTIEDSLKELEFFVTTNLNAPDISGIKRYQNNVNSNCGLPTAPNHYRENAKQWEHDKIEVNNIKHHDLPPAIIPDHIEIPEGSRFFVIKSFCLEHVKKSFAHGIWSSTYYGNRRLSEAYQKKALNAKVYLLFSVNGSGKFCGVAEMTSDLKDNLDTSIWSDQHDRYGKAFKLRWLIVRDIQNKLFKQHLIPSNDMKPVTHSRDTQEVPEIVSVSMLQTFLYNQNNIESFLGID